MVGLGISQTSCKAYVVLNEHFSESTLFTVVNNYEKASHEFCLF